MQNYALAARMQADSEQIKVKSFSDDSVYYVVSTSDDENELTLTACTCADHERHRTQCKHICLVNRVHGYSFKVASITGRPSLLPTPILRPSPPNSITLQDDDSRKRKQLKDAGEDVVRLQRALTKFGSSDLASVEFGGLADGSTAIVSARRALEGLLHS